MKDNDEFSYVCGYCGNDYKTNDKMQEEVHVHRPDEDGFIDKNVSQIKWWCVDCAEKYAFRMEKPNGDTYYEYFGDRQRKDANPDFKPPFENDRMTSMEKDLNKLYWLMQDEKDAFIKEKITGNPDLPMGDLYRASEMAGVIDWFGNFYSDTIKDITKYPSKINDFQISLLRSVDYLLSKKKPLEFMVDLSFNNEFFDEYGRLSDLLVDDMVFEEDYGE